MVQLFAVETASETSNKFIINEHFYSHKSNSTKLMNFLAFELNFEIISFMYIFYIN
jgi:hypothetical protein